MSQSDETPTPPPPAGLSDQGRAALSAALAGRARLPYPPLDDTEGWLAHVEMVDGFIEAQFGGLDLPVSAESRRVSGVDVHVLRGPTAPTTDDGPVYLDFHGGALVYGGGAVGRSLSSMSAMRTNLTHWAVDYRMPPLHPYPAGLDDAVAAYRGLLDEREPADIVVGGGSAGATLAAALLLRVKDAGLPMPAALVLLVPELDLTESGDTFETLRHASDLSSLREPNLLYAGGHDLADPYVSPLFGDVAGFPPTFLASGTRDLFLSNAVRMHQKLRAAGVEAELHVVEGMPHSGLGGAPEEIELYAELQRFLDRRCPGSPPQGPGVG